MPRATGWFCSAGRQHVKLLFDLHTHTMASGHAYSTLQENIAAARAGLEAYGFSDHTSGLPGAPHNIWFDNFKVIPRQIEGLRILRGAEVNVLDFEGHYDLEESIAKKLDYLIASLHSHTYVSGTRQQNTQALLKAMESPYIKIIGHPDDDRYPVDTDQLARAAAEMGVLLELNNSSLKPGCTRINGPTNARQMLLDCMRHGTRVVVNTDSHISYDVGRFAEAIRLLEEVRFPQELLANLDLARLDWITRPRG